MKDKTARQITKIAREVSKFTTRTLKTEGIGAAELDFIHVVRKNPGITQAGVRSVLGIDKGACARRAANLEQSSRQTSSVLNGNGESRSAEAIQGGH